MSAAKPIPGSPRELSHLGDHILKRRLDLDLEQKETAKRLGTNPGSLRNWEMNRRTVEVRFYPAIIAFLGYNPLPHPATRGQLIRYRRISRGWSRKRLAAKLGIDEATIRRIDGDMPRLGRRPVRALCALLGIEESI